MPIFQNMRFLIVLAILLMSAICSCRSSKQTVTQTADSTAVEVSAAGELVSVDDVLSVISASTDIDLSGVTVEFFPPDTAHPYIRAAPKSLKIESARACNDTKAARHEVATVNDKDTVNISIEQSIASAQDTRSDHDLLRPSDWVFFFSILAVIVILLIILIIKSRRNDIEL